MVVVVAVVVMDKEVGEVEIEVNLVMTLISDCSSDSSSSSACSERHLLFIRESKKKDSISSSDAVDVE